MSASGDSEKVGPFDKCHENGKLWSKEIRKGVKREGPWVYYNRDGTIDKSLTGTYKNDVRVSD